MEHLLLDSDKERILAKSCIHEDIFFINFVRNKAGNGSHFRMQKRVLTCHHNHLIFCCILILMVNKKPLYLKVKFESS